MNYRQWYEWGQAELAGKDVPEAALDARLLLEHVCHTKRHDLLAHGDRLLTPEEEKAYQNFIANRGKRIPLQHLTGVQEFMGLSFQVNEHVLIPRQDTEILVEEVMKNLHDGMSILDMCTGSGCILLSLLHYSNGCAGTGADISPKALEVAEKNAKALGIKARFVQSDLFEKIDEKFEIIVSNPPYIASEEIETLMDEVREHEPLNALDGKEDGLYFYRKIVKESKNFLKGGGMLFFEIGCSQAEAVSEMMHEAGFSEVQIVKDFAGLDRVVWGTLF